MTVLAVTATSASAVLAPGASANPRSGTRSVRFPARYGCQNRRGAP
jgi:hypothetical protein